MFYEVTAEDIIRVPPNMIRKDKKETIYNILRSSYIGIVRKDLGIIVTIKDVDEIGEGKIVPEDGGIYYNVKFRAIVYRPELNSLVYGVVNNIADFGAFVNIGPLDGLAHISQIMDDQVTVSGREALIGKTTKKVLKLKDVVKARIVSISYKDITTIKVALTMKQPGLGKLEWLEEKKK